MNSHCDRACQRCLDNLCTHKIPVFSTLPYEALESIARRIIHQDVPAGAVFIEAGVKNDRLTIISEGQAKACRYTADGREQILYIYSEGDFLGERDLILAQESPYQVEALTDVKLCQLTAESFHQFIQEHAEISMQIIHSLSRRLSRLEQMIQNMGQRSIEARISTALLDFAEQYGVQQKEGIYVRLPLSREGLASYIGITRETVSRKLSQLETENIIQSIGHKMILIRNQQALKDFSD